MSFPNYPAYKDSGVEWLGEVPQNWSVYSLKRTVDGCVNGLWGDEPDGENDIAVIRVADFERSFSTVGLDKLTYRSITPKERQSRLIKSGDLLIEKSGGGEKTLVGCVVLFTHEFDAITSNFVARMRPLAEFDSQFLCYAFGNLYQGRVNYPSVKQVTGIQNLDAESYLQERFCFPTRVEQTQIARFLDHETARIDALIEEQQRLIELLKEKRQAVISHAVTKGLDPTVPMKDSGVEWLGEVPAHWEVKRLRYLLKENGLIRGPFGGDLKKEIFVESGIKVYEQKNAIYRDFSLGDSFITQNKFSEMRRFEVKVGDYIMSCSGTIGRVYRIPEGAPVGIINQALLVIRFSEELGFEFADWIFVANFFVNQIIDNSQGGAMKNLVGMDVFTSISMPVPPVQEQLSIAKYLRGEISRFDSLISAAGQAVNLMQERRSALISAAVTGKIDVRGWQPPASTQAPEPAVAEVV